MLLIHLFIALLNYKGDSISKIDSLNDIIKFDKNKFENIKSYFNSNIINPNTSQSVMIDNNDLLEILIFQQYFLNILFSHFTNVYNTIFKRETMNLGGTKLKNLYIIDASTQSILFDLKYAQKRKNNYKYYKNQLLLKEILFQSNNLYQYYLNSYKNNNSKTKAKYLLFECTSTFPRLLFIFKFIPVLKGLIVIHLYQQKKLTQKKNNNQYHEVEITFCSPENNNKNSQEFQYCEPKKLLLINKFLEEFYLTTRKTDLFRIISNDKKFKYFNYCAINAINSVSIRDSDNNDIESIFNIINEKIEDQIVEDQKNREFIINTKEKNFDEILDIDISNFYKNIEKCRVNDKKYENNKKHLLSDNNEDDNTDINIRYQNDNQSMSNFVLTKKSINLEIDNNLSDTKTKYYNHLENININNYGNNFNDKKPKNRMIDTEISNSMNLTNIDFVTKNYDKSNYNSQDNFSLISEVEKASNNNLKEIEIHKNNKSTAKKKVKSNINILDLLDITNIKSINLKKNNSKKAIQESEENRFEDLSDDNENDNKQNVDHLSTSKFNVEEDNTKKGKKLRTKLAILDIDGMKFKSPLRKIPLN